MKAKGFDGKEYPWTLVKKNRNKVSTGHAKARTLLKEIFPLDEVFEEVTLPGSQTKKNGVLYADFYIRSRGIIIEIQGEQHESFNSFFHKDKMQFFRGQVRDQVKSEWCELNGITLIQLPVTESVDEWRTRIENR